MRGTEQKCVFNVTQVGLICMLYYNISTAITIELVAVSKCLRMWCDCMYSIGDKHEKKKSWQCSHLKQLQGETHTQIHTHISLKQVQPE